MGEGGTGLTIQGQNTGRVDRPWVGLDGWPALGLSSCLPDEGLRSLTAIGPSSDHHSQHHPPRLALLVGIRSLTTPRVTRR